MLQLGSMGFRRSDVRAIKSSVIIVQAGERGVDCFDEIVNPGSRYVHIDVLCVEEAASAESIM